MTEPTHFFLDTNVFDETCYKFESSSIKTFEPLAQKIGLKLVMPDPIERECRKHIKKNSVDAFVALNGVIRKFPFLNSWPALIIDEKRSQQAATEIETLFVDKFETFIDKYEITRLRYDLVSMNTIMDWYDEQIQPFEAGKKQKEFPDAITIYMLATYAHRNNIFIAVVSSDNGMHQACKRFPKLLHYFSLAKLTETIAGDASKVDEIHTRIQYFRNVLALRLRNEFHSFLFSHTNSDYFILDSAYTGLDILEVNVVGIAEKQCTVHFEAEMQSLHQLTTSYTDYPDIELEQIEESTQIYGTAKLNYHVDGEENEMTFLELDTREFTVNKEPSAR